MDDQDVIEGAPPPCCGNCPFYFPNANPATGNCREDSPKAIMIGMTNHPLRGPMPVVEGYFPPTAAAIVCGKHPRFGDYSRPVPEAVAKEPFVLKLPSADDALAAREPEGQA